MTIRIDKKLRVKEALSRIIGKTVSSDVVAHHEDGYPCSRLFLMFSDGSAFELWTDEEDMSIASDLDEYAVDQIVDVLGRRDRMQISAIRAPHEDPNSVQKNLLPDRSSDD
jgi:hypothetical protein